MWRYEQSTGKFYQGDRMVVHGYAGGNCGKSPEGINNSDMQGVSCIGPLPKGKYTMVGMLANSHMGPFAIRLIPDAGNAMFGRSGFFIHGDTTPSGNASQGCIILPRSVRMACWNSSDHSLEVF